VRQTSGSLSIGVILGLPALLVYMNPATAVTLFHSAKFDPLTGGFARFARLLHRVKKLRKLSRCPYRWRSTWHQMTLREKFELLTIQPVTGAVQPEAPGKWKQCFICYTKDFSKFKDNLSESSMCRGIIWSWNISFAWKRDGKTQMKRRLWKYLGRSRRNS
jgi:hypothetical protein